MLAGKQFRLKSTTIAIQDVKGKRMAVTIPEGEVIRVTSGRSNDSRMVDVVWNGHTAIMFAEDVQERGEEILNLQASA